MNEKIQEIFSVISVLLIAAVILGVVSFSRSTTQSFPRTHNYEHQGTFSYTTKVPAGIYDQPEVQTGEPIFFSLSDSFSLTYTYKFDTQSVAIISGQITLNASIRDDTGWKRTIPLVEAVEFYGNSYEATATIEFEDFEDIIGLFEFRTETERNAYYLVVQPEIVINGMVGAQPLSETFSSELIFIFSEKALII